MHYNFMPVLGLDNTKYKLKNMKIKAERMYTTITWPCQYGRPLASGQRATARRLAPSSLFIEFSEAD